MKTLTTVLLFLCAPAVWGQVQALNCKEDVVAGLEWQLDSQRFATGKPGQNRFTLVMVDKKLAVEPVAKILGMTPMAVECDSPLYIRCVAGANMLIYLPDQFRGRMSLLFDWKTHGQATDSLNVSHFSCVPG